jgi:DNA modification methylase
MPAMDRILLDVEPRKPRLAWQGMDRREQAAPAPAEVVEIVSPGRAVDHGDSLLSTASRGARARDDGGLPRNRLIWTSDNLVALETLLQDPGCRGKVDLVYVDPPFMVNADFHADSAIDVEIDGVPGSTNEPSRVEIVAYSDTWRQGLDDFLTMLRARLELLKELLAPTGSIFVHLDWHVVHYVKVLMDDLFGYDCFRTEIVWRYRRWPARTRNLQRMHDNILYYRRSTKDEPKFNVLYEELAESTRQTFGSKKQNADFSSGHRKPGQVEEDTPGAPLSDVWEIGVIAPIARERVGYPTQKPLALLERILRIGTDPGDLVLDCFAGSGTTLEAAERLGRRWIGIDSGKHAIHLTRKRLIQLHDQPRPVEAPRFDHVTCDACGNVKRRERPGKSPGLFDVGPFTLESVAASMAVPAPRAPLAIRLVHEVSGKTVRLTLDRCEIDVASFLASQRPARKAKGGDAAWAARREELDRWLAKPATWQKLVDFWAVDPDHGRRVGDGGAPIFASEWQSFRVRRGRGEVESVVFTAEITYSEAGRYRLAARVTDVFGNDGAATVEVEVR